MKAFNGHASVGCLPNFGRLGRVGSWRMNMQRVAFVIFCAGLAAGACAGTPSVPATPVPENAYAWKGGEVFRFDYTAAAPPFEGRTLVVLEAETACTVNGIIQWVRLDLDAETALETRPDPGAPEYFMWPFFWPLKQPARLRSGQGLRVGAAHDGLRLTIWLDGIA